MIDDFQNSYEYLGRCRRWGRCGARRACLAGQQWILCLTRLDPALAAIFLAVAFHDGLHTVGLKRLLFLPRPSPRHRGTPSRCWGPRGCQHAREVLLDVGLMWQVARHLLEDQKVQRKAFAHLWEVPRLTAALFDAAVAVAGHPTDCPVWPSGLTNMRFCGCG